MNQEHLQLIQNSTFLNDSVPYVIRDSNILVKLSMLDKGKSFIKYNNTLIVSVYDRVILYDLNSLQITQVYNFEYPIYNITTVRVEGINVFFVDDHRFAYSCSKLKILSREISPKHANVYQVDNNLYVCCIVNGCSFIQPKTLEMVSIYNTGIELMIQSKNIVKVQNENDIIILSKHTQVILENELNNFVYPVISKIILQYLCYFNEQVGVKGNIK